MLIGTYTHALDNKGRIFIPSRWRESVGDTLVIMQGMLAGCAESCLFAMSLNEWDQFSSRLSQLPLADMAGQAVRRRLYASACACEIDKQGRILLPSALRELSGIETDATLIGVGNRIELWEPSRLTAHFAETAEHYSASLEHLAEIGI